jgi:hypothetical protein
MPDTKQTPEKVIADLDDFTLKVRNTRFGGRR